MKKLNNFIFSKNLEDGVKCYLVLVDSIDIMKKDKLVIRYDINSQLIDTLYTLSYLEKVNLPTQIVVDSVEEFDNLLAKYFLFKGREIPKDLSASTDDIVEFKRIVPYLKVNGEIEQFYYTYLMIKTLRRLCPWDRSQTHESLIPELIEEPLECVEEIKKQDFRGIREELGDILLQILLHSEIGYENREFTFSEVCKNLFDKMYIRHPHVFIEEGTKTPNEVLNDWEKNKKKKEALNISKILASFITTLDLQEEAKYIGLEFRKIDEIFDKIREELEEVRLAYGDKVKEEIGDLLFSVINLARFLGIDPAHALFISYQKFMDRVRRFKELSAEEKEDIDKAWEKIKKDERRI